MSGAWMMGRQAALGRMVMSSKMLVRVSPRLMTKSTLPVTAVLRQHTSSFIIPHMKDGPLQIPGACPSCCNDMLEGGKMQSNRGNLLPDTMFVREITPQHVYVHRGILALVWTTRMLLPLKVL